MPADPPRIIHGYELVRQIGIGSFGEVWEAKAPGGHAAAVKLIPLSRSQAGAHLELSALEAMKRFDHPYLLKNYASYTDPDQVVIVMELAAGTLHDRLKYCLEEKRPGIPQDELLHYMRHTADALDYLHGEKIIHRDIKPANILLFRSTPSYVKLGDCGLVREYADTDETMTTLGTPAYIAPEVWQRKGGPWSDQYSLAITYVELRQGYRPLKASNPLELAVAHLEEEPDLDGLEEQERQVVRRALAKQYAQRFPSCLAFVEEMERVMEARPYSFRGSRVGLSFKKPREAEPPPRPPRTEPIEVETPNNATYMPKSGDTHQAVDSSMSRSSFDISSKVSDPPMTPTLLVIPEEEKPEKPPPPPASWLSRIVLGLVGLLVLAVCAVVLPPLFRGDGGGTDKDDEKDKDAVLAQDKNGDKPPIDQDKGKVDDKDKGVILKPAVRLVMPPGFHPAKDSATVQQPGDTEYHRRIVSSKLPEAFFRLLLPRAGQQDDPKERFYVLETKVTNGMYRKFADEKGEDVAGVEWKKGGRGKEGIDLGNEQSAYPVLRVTRDQAMAFTTWFAKDARLPSAAQLDRAAGYQPDLADSEAGPFKKGPKVAVNRRDKGPCSVHGDEDDDNVSPDDNIRGLAGNGREWTRDDLPGTKLGIFRGRSYSASGPLTYRMLGEQRRGDGKHTWVQNPQYASPYMGFRIVIEVK